jgi:bifunctional UDP-N-acetylglucosamine pyrophosphorylase/glucosamine-1-phosphate N-acetyltransferase
MLDPANTYVDTTVIVGRDVTLFPGTILQGDTVIGDGCEIGPNTQLVDCAVAAQRGWSQSTGPPWPGRQRRGRGSRTPPGAGHRGA